MVRGLEGGDWIYSAKVIDQVGPIHLAVFEKLLSNRAKNLQEIKE
jgi:hypothetical protein